MTTNPGATSATSGPSKTCSGSVAVHIREMARALGKPVQERKIWTADYKSPMSATEEWRYYRAESRERYNS